MEKLLTTSLLVLFCFCGLYKSISIKFSLFHDQRKPGALSSTLIELKHLHNFKRAAIFVTSILVTFSPIRQVQLSEWDRLLSSLIGPEGQRSITIGSELLCV